MERFRQIRSIGLRKNGKSTDTFWECGKKKENLNSSKNLRRQDYTEYELTGNDKVRLLLKGIAVTIGGAYFFYRSAAAVIPFLLFLPVYLRKEKKKLGQSRRLELRREFKEAALAVGVNLKAGYAVENAFAEAKEDMKLLYGEASDIYLELKIITQALHNNIPLENALLDFGRRSSVREIQDFAEVFAIGKRSNGDITEIVDKTAAMISSKIEVKREIETIMSAKVLEQKMMSAVPFLILLYLDITSPGFFTPLYHNFAGVVIMTGCLLLYLICLTAAGKITEIEG